MQFWGRVGELAVHQSNNPVANKSNVYFPGSFTLILVFYYGQVVNTAADSTFCNFLLNSISVHIFFHKW